MSECHSRNQPYGHIHKCNICKTYAKKPKTKYRPAIWKRRNVAQNAYHPHKQKSYESVDQDTQITTKKLTESKQIDEYKYMYTCELIQWWDLPLILLMKFLSIPVRQNFSTTATLGECFNDCILQTFPLFKHSKLTMQSVITCLRQKNLHGLVKISGHVGAKTINSLKGFKIFSHLDDQGKMINTNRINNMILSTNMVNFLLTSPAIPDFIITDIQQIFIWPNVSIKPYQSACETIKHALQNNFNDPQFLNLCKYIANIYIGQYAINPNKHKSCQILQKESFQSLSQMANLSTTQNLTQDIILAKFNTTKPYAYPVQNHILVVQQSRMLFIEMLTSFLQFLDFLPVSANCDGLILASKNPFAPTGKRGGNVNYPVLTLDSILNQSLTKEELWKYLWLKNKYFQCILVCPTHYYDYINSLSDNIAFNPRNCCINSNSTDTYPFKLKIESYGEKCVIFGINRSCQIQYNTQKPIIKASGMQVRNIDKLFENVPKELKDMFMS